MKNTIKEGLTIQKFLQQSEIDNRRNIRTFLAGGLVKVNGQIIKDPKFILHPRLDQVKVNNKLIRMKSTPHKYFVFNKPDGIISSLSDPQGRPTIKDFIRKIPFRVYPVGRLDFHTEGLIILTNDGDFSNFVLSVKNQIPKSYSAKVKGLISQEKIRRLNKSGVVIDQVKVIPQLIKFVQKTPRGNSWILIKIVEGRKHVVRNFFKFSGHPVKKLKRISIGSLKLKHLPLGQWREVSSSEIEYFKKQFHYDEPGKADRGKKVPIGS